MKLLSVASELFPLVKTGGLADVAGALPIALVEEGIEVRSLIPGYPAVMAALRDAETVHHDPSLFGGPARLLATQVGALSLFVLDAPHLYDRSGLYAGPAGDWADNPFRFAALSRVAAQIGQGMLTHGTMAWRPDVIHAHDWQAGLTAAYLHFDGGPRPGTVFTIHNLAFQGQVPAELLPALGLPHRALDMHGVEHYGAIGFLKAGIWASDRVTTVSPSYAEEIRTEAGGMGLDGLLRSLGGRLTGILNGIDTTVWNPATDPRLPARFNADDPTARAINKARLQARLGLATDPATPLFGVISRLSWQKGMDLLQAALPLLLKGGGQLAILGAGDAAIQADITAASRQYPGRVGAILGYDEDVAHLIQGGADALVVPSRFEPCGLTQLCALRYGAVPLVSRVGGLQDSVIDANEAALAAGVATGLQFAPVTASTLEQAITRALALWARPDAWQTIQRNGMTGDHGWNRPARRYARLYKEIA